MTQQIGTTIGRLSGWSGDNAYFTFREYREYRPEAVLDVLRGRVAGVMFRAVVTADASARIARRFWASEQRQTRGVEAPGYYLGTYHYHKTTERYLAESAQAAPALDAVLGADDPLVPFYGRLARALETVGGIVRPARHGTGSACRGLLRSWQGRGQYALAPHEDRSQCGEPRQADFEIQRVRGYEVGALNICLENGGAGRLAFWNIKPDEAVKRRLGLHHTGSPYPVETLEGIDCQWIDVHAGDVYVFNGSHVHAVEPNADPSSRRTTLAGMMGFVDEQTVVSWT